MKRPSTTTLSPSSFVTLAGFVLLSLCSCSNSKSIKAPIKKAPLQARDEPKGSGRKTTRRIAEAASPSRVGSPAKMIPLATLARSKPIPSPMNQPLVPLYGLDLQGRFICSQVYHALPSEENAGCLMANGHEVKMTVTYLSSFGQPPKRSLTDPIRLWIRRRCGSTRRVVPRPSKALLKRVIPEIASLKNTRAIKKPDSLLPVVPCVDQRLSISLVGVQQTRIPAATFRFQLSSAQSGNVTLVWSGKAVHTWSLTRQAVPSRCPGDPPQTSLDDKLDLQILCDKKRALVTAMLWLRRFQSACVARHRAGLEPSPTPPLCVLSNDSGQKPRAWQAPKHQRFWLDLDSGAKKPIHLKPIQLHP